FTAPPPTQIYPLSLHDALPISRRADPVVVALADQLGSSRRAVSFDEANVDTALAEGADLARDVEAGVGRRGLPVEQQVDILERLDRKSTRLNSSHLGISYAVFC